MSKSIPASEYTKWDKYIDDTSNKGEWIPVIERLPEVGTCVLTSIAPEKADSYRVVISKFNNESWWTDGTVEAWQPLPEPYKAESEAKNG